MDSCWRDAEFIRAREVHAVHRPPCVGSEHARNQSRRAANSGQRCPIHPSRRTSSATALPFPYPSRSARHQAPAIRGRGPRHPPCASQRTPPRNRARWTTLRHRHQAAREAAAAAPPCADAIAAPPPGQNDGGTRTQCRIRSLCRGLRQPALLPVTLFGSFRAWTGVCRPRSAGFGSATGSSVAKRQHEPAKVNGHVSLRRTSDQTHPEGRLQESSEREGSVT